MSSFPAAVGDEQLPAGMSISRRATAAEMSSSRRATAAAGGTLGGAEEGRPEARARRVRAGYGGEIQAKAGAELVAAARREQRGRRTGEGSDRRTGALWPLLADG
ncbi:unnamed protein product [Urochloa humidicola]